MGKIPVVILLLLAIWVGYSLYTQGPDRAFGGLFGLLSSPKHGEPPEATRSQRLVEENIEQPPAQAPPEGPWWAEP